MLRGPGIFPEGSLSSQSTPIKGDLPGEITPSAASSSGGQLTTQNSSSSCGKEASSQAAAGSMLPKALQISELLTMTVENSRASLNFPNLFPTDNTKEMMLMMLDQKNIINVLAFHSYLDLLFFLTDTFFTFSSKK